MEENRAEKKAADVQDIPARMKVWERKLLDFSLRNTLLNFRVTKNTIQLMAADLGKLEDELAEGKDFLVAEVPEEWAGTQNDAKIYEIHDDKEGIENFADEEMKKNRLRTFLKAEELDKSLKGLHRAARVSMEENGTNTLYLALGFLRWYESDTSDKPRYAPLIMIPVDLVRNFRNRGYVIRSRDEETQINITLLEYLKQDCDIVIEGLDPLPCDEQGIDISLVFQMIEQGIAKKRRWVIDNKVFIGLFSFGRFVMWNDLRNRAQDLLENKIVASLIEGKMTWQAEDLGINDSNLDEKISPESIAVPLSADASQMTAIAAAAGGQSFVLHGPPGTGKSQTITNMIANALYQGKSVLFVAEKMAALSVVRHRLEKIGLGPFCLELHSNKTNKTSVLNQLNQALSVGRIKHPEEYQATAEELKKLRDELNYIMNALHCNREYGCSLYAAISIYEQNIEWKGSIIFDREQVNAMTGGQIAAWLELVKSYKEAASIAGAYDQNPWVGYEGTEYSIDLREQLADELWKKEKLCRAASDNVRVIKEWCGLITDNDSAVSDHACGDERAAIETLLKLCSLLKDPAPILSAALESADYTEIINQIKKLAETGLEYQQRKTELLASYEPQILQYPAGDAALRYQQAQGSFALSRWIKTKKLVKEMKLYAKKQDTVTKEMLPAIYEQISHLLELQTRINAMPAGITSLTGSIFIGQDTDFEKLKAAADKTARLHDLMASLMLKEKGGLIQKFTEMSENERIIYHADHLETVISALDEMTKTYHINLSKEESSPRWLADTADTLARYQKAMDTFKEWVSFNRIEMQVKENGLIQLVNAYHEGAVTADTMMNAVLCNLYYMLSVKTITQDQKLNHFQGSQYENRIADYDALLQRFQTLTLQELAARLSAQIPNSTVEGAASSELGILKKAIKSNGRMMSIRKLFNDIPTLLRKLTPCMLMSPISVAQYIDPKFPKFDLVIFDEASQIETSGAVGTIARGENVVVVGDPKQLPPTSFFSSNYVDEENYEQEDLESLLDDCLAISMPQKYLKWHYRSRHESLIAYSNAAYYDNKLYTFPSPKDLVSEVKLVPLEGSYDKGKTKQNRAEAHAVVAEIIRRLQDEELRKDSIGVVTFSLVQQNLIEDLLLDEFTKYPELAEWDAESGEPVFIKNLENVQGDERDVILFSIGYGPDEEGRVSMNFGPLNQEGGWRRLNVAISRARKSMIVYAVIRPEQIDLSRTKSKGVAGLKGFLEYAARGRSALTAHAAESQAVCLDNMTEEIAGAIKAMGYRVQTNIGDSKYKLDIGIIHPEDPDKYLLGILLDGRNSREAALSKDRYILQPGVLEGLGWNLLRVWALDYMDNPQKILGEIDRKIRELIEKEKAVLLSEKNDADDASENKELVFEKMEESFSNKKEPYRSVVIDVNGSSESFYEPESRQAIRRLAVQILIEEAPVSRKLMMRKVLGAWGISRCGSRVENVFDEVLQKIQKHETIENANIFYWRIDQEPDQYDVYRAKDQSGNQRSMDEIPVQEILSALTEVLSEQVALSKEDLIRETGKKFGYTRIGAVIEKAVSDAAAYGIMRDRIKETDGRFSLK